MCGARSRGSHGGGAWSRSVHQGFQRRGRSGVLAHHEAGASNRRPCDNITVRILLEPPYQHFCFRRWLPCRTVRAVVTGREGGSHFGDGVRDAGGCSCSSNFTRGTRRGRALAYRDALALTAGLTLTGRSASSRLALVSLVAAATLSLRCSGEG